MIGCLQRMSRSLDVILRDVDVSSMTSSDAIAVLRAASAIERKAATLKTLVAARATSDEGWAAAGHRSAESWVAHETGSGYGDAARALHASARMGELPAVEAAARAGELSGPQLGMLGDAATPENSESLLETARNEGADQLRKACDRERARTRSNDDERKRNEKAHRERHYKSWKDGDGAYCFSGKTTAMVGAEIEALLGAEADAVFKAAWAEGRRESHGAYKLDALVRLLRLGGGAAETPSSSSRRKASNVQVIVRVDASRLAGDEGVCETSTGPIPVDDAIGAILAGAFTKIVLKTGVDITKVTHQGRHIPAEVKTAVMDRDGFKCVHCGATQQLQIHHYKVDYAKGGATAYWNLGTLCRHCHDLVTTKGYVLAGGPGDWRWIEPNGGRAPP